MSADFFQTFALLGIWIGAFLVLRSLHEIGKLLAAILDEMTTGERKKQHEEYEHEANFYSRGESGKEPK